MPDDFAFLLCDGCSSPTPMASSKAEVRALAAAHGWQVDVGELSEDYCPSCLPAGS